MSTSVRGRHVSHGFSLVELLVAIVLAGIIFGAMVPFFANALKRTSGDEFRVDSTNIAQDRIEQVHLLDYADITQPNLNNPPSPVSAFGDGRFGHTYTLVGGSRPYRIDYEVDPLSDAAAAQKFVKVSVSRAGEDFVTTADTIIKNPAAGDSTYSDAEPTDLSITVYFTNLWSYVISPGVVVRRVQTNVTPNATTTPTPGAQMPNAGMQELTWTGLTGGPNYTYTITTYSNRATWPMGVTPFRLWKDGRWPVDTYPGGD